jgi:uncharacterized repeat protein (TIGR03943 family)
MFKPLLLFGIGGYLLFLIVSGRLTFYVDVRFSWLTFAASLILILVGLIQLWKCRYDMHSNVTHSSNRVDYLALLLIPVLLGICVPPRPLGAATLSVRGDNAVGVIPAIASNRQVSLVSAEERNLLDWNVAFAANPDPTAFRSQQAHVTGFVYRKDDRFSGDRFLLSRFVVNCCVADATAVGLVVKWQDAETLENDRWVDVVGHFESEDGQSMPILVAELVTSLATPTHPYLYP